MKKILTVIIALFNFVCCSNEAWTDLQPNEFENYILKKDVQLVDVRSAEEFEEGYINGALNIDFRKDDFLKQAELQLNKEKPVALYCRTGRRSKNAAKQLTKIGFKTVVNLDGGYLGWKAAGKL